MVPSELDSFWKKKIKFSLDLRLPWSLYYPRKLRETVMDQLTQMYQNYNKNNVNELEKYLNKNAFECLNVLEKKLGKQLFMKSSIITFLVFQLKNLPSNIQS